MFTRPWYNAGEKTGEPGTRIPNRSHVRTALPGRKNDHNGRSADTDPGRPESEKEVRSMSIPRPEHPRPQFVREAWMNLNGPWDFLFDFGNSGLDRELWRDDAFDAAVKSSPMPTSIVVPFCPESRLSGIGYTDWIAAVWYRRSFRLEENQVSDLLTRQDGWYILKRCPLSASFYEENRQEIMNAAIDWRFDQELDEWKQGYSVTVEKIVDEITLENLTDYIK